MNKANHKFANPLPKYRAAQAVNNRLRKPTDSEESRNVHIDGLVKVMEAIGSETAVPACIIYLTKNDYNCIRIT